MSAYPPVVQSQPYSKAIAFRKVLGSVGTVLAALAPAVVPSLIDYFSSDANVATVLKVDPKLLGLAPFIAGGIRLIANWRKNRS